MLGSDRDHGLKLWGSDRSEGVVGGGVMKQSRGFSRFKSRGSTLSVIVIMRTCGYNYYFLSGLGAVAACVSVCAGVDTRDWKIP